MIIDLDKSGEVPLAGRYDVCIAGAGVAGIALAKTLADQGRKVLLLEAGGRHFSDKSQEVYKGRVTGHEYFDLDITRLRFLGGSSNHWGGWCRPLDAHDFERHEHIPGSGWPISRHDLDPFLPRALDMVGLSEVPEDRPLAGSGGDLQEIYFRTSRVAFGKKYRDFLTTSDRADLLLHANLLDIVLDPMTGRVSSFRFCGYHDGPVMLDAKADRFVLALGGIENARALLNANTERPDGIGNEHGVVGRYFMEHPHFDIGFYLIDPARTDLGKVRRFIAPTRQLLREARMGNCGVRLEQATPATEVMKQQRTEVRDLICASNTVTDWVQTMRSGFRCPVPVHRPPRIAKDLPFPDAGLLRAAAEQVPNPNSRVKLSEESDRFGRRQAALHWQLMPTDKETIRRNGLAVGTYFAKRDIGRVKLFDWVLDEDAGFPGLAEGEEVGGNHHMGTTRMGTSVRDSVVDANCRLHSSDNLYVAGSSVFRTAGHANPTLTVVQLALRLADHLAKA